MNRADHIVEEREAIVNVKNGTVAKQDGPEAWQFEVAGQAGTWGKINEASLSKKGVLFLKRSAG